MTGSRKCEMTKTWVVRVDQQARSLLARPRGSVTRGEDIEYPPQYRRHPTPSVLKQAEHENPHRVHETWYETVREPPGLLKCPRGSRRGQKAKATGRKTRGNHNLVDRATAQGESVLT
jgi:hypothetical protein